MTQKLKSLLARYTPHGVDWMGIRYMNRKILMHQFRKGIPQTTYMYETGGYFIEVLADGQFGYASLAADEEELFRAAVDRALTLAKASAPYKLFQASSELRPSSVGNFKSKRVQEFTDTLSLAQEEDLRTLCFSMQVSPKIQQTYVTLLHCQDTMELVATNGCDVSQDILSTAIKLHAIAEHNGKIEERSLDHGVKSTYKQTDLSVLDFNMLHQEAARVGAEALLLLDAPECPTGVYDLVLAPDQMFLQIHESIGHALELDRILGDERNYAGWSFVKVEDAGKLQYGSPLLNVTFDPTIEGELASYRYDNQGNEAKKEYLIRNGILERFLGSPESQYRARVQGVANARVAFWPYASIDRMANINIEVGTSSMRDIISSIENGIYMETNRSWSIDDYRRKFQFGCELGRIIKDGQLREVVRNPNYRGITIPFWHSLFKVGDASTWQACGALNCGKGEPNQTVFVGHASPVCAFRNVEVFGGKQ